MKTRILFSILLFAALGWVGYALWLTKHQQKILSPEVFFSDKSTIWIFNRSDFCTEIPDEWQMKDMVLGEYLKSEQAFFLWKSIAIQHNPATGIILVLWEEKAGITAQQWTEFLDKASLHYFDNKESTQDNWHLLRANGYLAVSNSPIALSDAEDNTIQVQLSRRDIQASYSLVSRDKIEDIYCFAAGNRRYITTVQGQELISKSTVAADAEMFVVIPDFMPEFFFVETQTMHAISAEWNDSPLIPFLDKGVVFAGDATESVFFADLAAQYTPKELLEKWAIERNGGQANIYQLQINLNGFEKPYATGLENVLIVSDKKELLERIRLSYQMGKGWSSNSRFSEMRKDQPRRVTMRWMGQSQIPNHLRDKIPNFEQNGNLVVRRKEKELIWSLYSSTSALAANDTPSTKAATELVWNFSLENKNSRFFIGDQTICVYNPDKGTISQVNGAGKIAQWITVTEPIKTIHSLEGGYLIELFNKLLWFPEDVNDEKIKEIPFKGAIVSNIARYIWKGHPSIGFISENYLYRISLKSGEIQRDKMTQNSELNQAQLHAFNYEGDLTFGLFHDKNFHLFNTKRTNWKTIQLDGQIKWSEKLNGKIHYLTQQEDTYHYHIFLESKRSFKESMDYLSQTLSGAQPVFIFGSSGQIRLAPEGVPAAELYALRARKPEMTKVILKGLKPKYILALDGISNEIEIIDVEKSQNISEKGSQFLKFVSPNKVITFVDGQLVMYKF